MENKYSCTVRGLKGKETRVFTRSEGLAEGTSSSSQFFDLLGQKSKREKLFKRLRTWDQSSEESEESFQQPHSQCSYYWISTNKYI